MERSASDAVIDIGACRLDVAAGTVVRGSEIVPMRAKTFALLCQLVENPGHVVTKDDLLSHIWPDVIVSEDSLTQTVRDLRKCVGDEEQKFIRTVPKRGYMFVPDAPQAKPRMTGGREPTVAVLPFQVTSSEAADQILIDGIVEEITTGLARFRGVTVIARSSAFAFPSDARPDHQAVARELGADYLVEGSVRRMGARFRAAVSLIHAPTSRQVWSETFDRRDDELLTVDTLIARQVIVRLVANIEDSVIQATSGIATGNLRAFENLMRGIHFLRGYGTGVNEAARDHFVQAIEADPDYGLAHAYLALAEVILADYGGAPRAVLEGARDRLILALRLAPQEPRCHRIMGLIRLYLMDHAAAETHLRRAHDLNPYDADTLAQLGFVVTMRGRAQEGLGWTVRAIELNPFRPPWYDSDHAFSLYSLGRYRDAIEALNNSPESGIYQYIRLAAAYAMAEDLVHAADYMRRAFELLPELDPVGHMRTFNEFEHDGDRQHLLDGVERALEAYRNSLSAAGH